MKINPYKPRESDSMELFTKDIGRAIDENKPCWIKFFKNGVCATGSGFDSVSQFMTMDHMESSVGIDLADYDVLHPSENFF